jgi:hypothetical protein
MTFSLYSPFTVSETMADIHFSLHQVKDGIIQNPQDVLENALASLRSISKIVKRPEHVTRCNFLIKFLHEIKAEIEA